MEDKHLGILAKKVRKRSGYTFANINLLGRCNAHCYFCLGFDLEKEYEKHNNLNTFFTEWENWDNFINDCNSKGIKQIFLTGQNTDSLTYKYLDDLIEYLHERGFSMGLRTNGILAKNKINLINKCRTSTGDAVGYSIHTLCSETQDKIMKVKKVPDWDFILKNTTVPMRVAIVLNRYNISEFYELIHFLSNYDSVKYIQVRRICTDNRYELLEEDMILFEEKEKEVSKLFPIIGEFETAKTYRICNKPVNFWRTVKTTVNSINYFTNGTLSDNYFVVEGFSNKNKIPLGTKKLIGNNLWD